MNPNLGPIRLAVVTRFAPRNVRELDFTAARLGILGIKLRIRRLLRARRRCGPVHRARGVSAPGAQAEALVHRIRERILKPPGADAKRRGEQR